MNEEALEYSFNLFKADGYNGTLEDYKALIEKDKEALDYSYGLFSKDGYSGSIGDFSTLVGVGNQQDPAKETASVGSENQAVDTDSSSENGSSVLSEANEIYIFDDKTKVARPDIVKNLRDLNIKLTGKVSSDLYDFKNGKAYKVKDGIEDQQLLDAYFSKFKKKPLKTYKGQELDEVVVTYDKKLEQAKEIQSKLDFLKPTDDDFNAIKQTAYEIFVPENELPKRLVRLDKFDPGYYETVYPSGYKDYLEKANGDLEKAKALYIEDKTKGAHAAKVEDWARENESLLKGSSVEGFLEQQELAAKVIGDRKAKELSAKNETATALNNEIEINNKRLLELSELTFDNEADRLEALAEFKEIKGINENLAVQAKKLYEESLELAEEANDNALLLDVVKRTYSIPKIIPANLTASAADIVAGVLNIPEWLYTSIGATVTDKNPLVLQMQYRGMMMANPGGINPLVIDAAKDFSKDLRSKVAKPIDVTDISSLGDFGYWSADLVSNQLPNVALMVFAPEVALPILGASATGNKYSSMMENMTKYGEEYSGWQLISAPLIVGAAEYLTERISLGQLRNVKNIFKKSPDALKAANTYIENNILKGQYFKTTFAEAGGEGIATLSENVTDIFILNDDTKHIWDGVPNAIASGGFMSGVIFKAPAIGAKLLKPFAGSDIQAKLQRNFEEFQKISKELNENKNLSESAKNSLIAAQVKITQNSNDLLQQEFDKIDGLSEVDKQRLIEIDKKATEIEVKAKEIYNDTSIDSDIKKLLIDDLNTEYKKIKSEKNVITKIGVRETMLEEAVQSGVVENVSFKSFDTQAEMAEYLINTGRAKKGQKIDFNYGTIFQRKDGTQEILINKELAKQHNRISTADHEFLHAILYNTVKNNKQAAINLGKALFAELQSLDSRNLFKETDFGKRLKNELIQFNEGAKDQATAWEEALTLFSEALVNNEFDTSIFTNTVEGKSFIQKIKEFIQRLLGKEIGTAVEFNTGQDVINFIKEYNESFQTGKWGENIRKLAKEGAKGKLVEGGEITFDRPASKASAASDIQQQINSLEDQLLDNAIDYDTYEAKVSILEKRLNEAEAKEEAPKPKAKKKEAKKGETLKQATAKSKKILDDIGNDPKGFNKNNPKIYEVLEGIIRSKSKVFRTAGGNVVNLTNLPGFEMENMVQETIAGLVPLINKFDPKKNDSLFGYLNAQLANKMRGALKSGKVTEQKFTEDVTELKGVAAEETTTKQPEKPKYVKIMDADVFDTKVINNISDKMVSTVRVLKNKLVAALGKNQNTSPLIAEILSDISTQADIDIKKAMGGKKDGALKKFLLNNKQAIVENLTTTFLMGKDQGNQVLGGLPIAIQKQVDGKFLSYPDWIGKKIDRETTEKRGATAGNQIVRRVPANRISDADYLSFFLQPTGNPIRGRKEALAKELSGEIGLELFVEAIEAGEGPIFDAFENNREMIGEVLNDYYFGEVIKQVERGTVKFSMKADKFDSLSKEAISAMLQPTKTERINALEEFKAKYTGVEYNEIKKLIIDPLQEKLEYVANELGRRNRGFAREDVVLSTLKSVEKSIDGLKIITKKGAKSDNRVDIVLDYKGYKIGIELKLDKYSRLGSFHVSNYLNSPALTLETQFSKQILDTIKSNSNIDKLKDFVVKNGGKIENGKLLVTESLLSKISSNKLRSKAQTFLTLPIDLIYERYLQKQTPTDYMDFSDLGLFYLQNNPLNLPIQQLEGDVKLRIHFKRNKARKDGFIMLSMVAEPQLTTQSASKLTEKSEYTLASEKSVKDVFKNAKVLPAKAQNEITKNSSFGQIFNPVKDMKKFDPYEMADIIASELFRDSKKYRNRQKFEYLYKNLTKEEQYQVQKEMRKKNLTPFGRGISVWDFDDTLATTKSNVLYTMPDGTKGKLSAEEFAKQGDDLLEQGAEFDFSEFEKVMKGAKGPMFEKALERNKRFGNENVFILTARPANSAIAIHEFLKGIGLNIKLENIVGLGNSSAQAKADWVTSMVAEGYNDFYFADDAYKNVKAVQKVLEVADVKSKVQQAYIKNSQAADPVMLDKEFNLMLERTKGVKAGAVISPSRAAQLGKGKGRFDFFLPPNAEDFQGLLYKFLGKGKQGDADLKFFRENLFEPFNIAENAMSSFRQRLADNLRILKKELGDIDKVISVETINKIEDIGFTPDQAVRVFVWNRLGEEIPDLTKQEKAKILSVVRRDASLMAYAKELIKITEQFGGYPPPSKTWFAGNSTSDLYQYANENVRAEYLTNWQSNADAIFNKKNMTKIEALYGKDFAKNLKEVLRRMKSGSNRPLNLNDTGSRMLDYINGSVGTIMFLNMRSAVLQTISAVNFINWHDNNIFKAGATLANPKNYIKSFMEIMNSDFLKQRRNGLEINVSEAEIANAVEQSKNKAKAIFSSIIKFGYKPTQFADSFAIAVGGTSFLINRTKTYEKTGLSFKEAREKAFTDFRAIAEENQQSSRTDRTSNIQASNLGRLVFAFNNTPFQMTRLFKKATLDLINGRGDIKTNISKMLYYGAIQNVIFFSLQQAFMAMLFGADEDDREDIDNRTERLLNSTIDSILRGSGLPGAIISTVKNVIMEYATQEAKGDWRADHGKTLIQALNFSPPLGSKASRIYSALKGKKYEKTDFDALRNQSKIISAVTNIPVDRTITKIDNLRVATSEPIETWKRLALFAGWDQWSLGVYDDLKAIEDKEKGKEKKKSRSEIMKEVWRKRKEEDKKHRDSIINTFRKKK